MDRLTHARPPVPTAQPNTGISARPSQRISFLPSLISEAVVRPSTRLSRKCTRIDPSDARVVCSYSHPKYLVWSQDLARPLCRRCAPRQSGPATTTTRMRHAAARAKSTTRHLPALLLPTAAEAARRAARMMQPPQILLPRTRCVKVTRYLRHERRTNPRWRRLRKLKGHQAPMTTTTMNHSTARRASSWCRTKHYLHMDTATRVQSLLLTGYGYNKGTRSSKNRSTSNASRLLTMRVLWQPFPG